MSNPTFIVLGAALAALIAGFFSYVNLVSLKENKVSEFRLAWIDGLREEVASYTAAIQHLARMERTRHEWTDSDYGDESNEVRDMKWFSETQDSYLAVVSSLTKIQLRLNPRHIAERPQGPEACLMRALEEARAAFNNAQFDEAIKASGSIRIAAAPLLKSTWDDVKNGEPRYRRVRQIAQQVITSGVGLLATVAIAIVVLAAVTSP
jgi:hypothetical protein